VSKTDFVLLIGASLLLLAGNWLAFHDIAEVHTGRDWIMLAASVLVWAYVARVLLWRRVASR
jgi:hypothetical protein